METTLDCIPCLFRQAVDAARRVSDDPDMHELVVRELAGWICMAGLKQSPPVMAQRLNRYLRDKTGVADPYAADKARDNALALSLLPGLRQRLAAAADPMALAVRLAIAGNLIDLGVKSQVNEAEIIRAITDAETCAFSGDIAAFKRRAAAARTILYLADNAGEIVLDRLLIEQLGPSRVTVAVRGAPIINDATLADARAAGLDAIVPLISNGSDAPGTVLEDCSQAFRAVFDQTDVVLAKGQGNFETLSDAPRDICFLFKVKCPVIATKVALPVGTQALVWACA